MIRASETRARRAGRFVWKIMLAWTLAMLAPTVVRAGDNETSEAAPSDEERARDHFFVARALFEAGEYERAVEEFEISYRLSGKASLLFNMALCHERLGDLPRAIERLEGFLAADPSIVNRERLEQRLVKMRERLAEREEAAAEGKTAERGDPEVPTASEPSSPPDKASRWTVPIVVSLGVAGVGAIAGATFGVLSLAEKGQLDDRCAPSCTDSDLARLRTYRTVADVGFGVGIVGAVTAAVLFFTGRARKEEPGPEVQAWSSPSGAGVDATWSF